VLTESRVWVPAAIVLGAVLLGFVLRGLVRFQLPRLFRKTATDLDDLALKAMDRHLPWWPLLAAIAPAARLTAMPEKSLALVDRGVLGLAIVSATMVIANFLTELVTRRTNQVGAEQGTTSLARNIVRVVILALGALVLLTNLGIAVTPLLTALGVGSLAVALALQPTLSNLIAGIHLTVARPIRIGDFIELETGRQGYVVDIGWRAIRIRELPNNLVVVPNSRVAEMMLINYSLPEPEQSVLVQVGVAYGSDLPKVERVTIAVAKEVLRDVQGGVGKFDPFIRFHTFGDSSINFSVILRVRGFADRYLVTHEFIKRLHPRFAAEQIEIPFPQRVVHLPERAAACVGGESG
jgi:small-conductance mechanosensitive channel